MRCFVKKQPNENGFLKAAERHLSQSLLPGDPALAKAGINFCSLPARLIRRQAVLVELVWRQLVQFIPANADPWAMACGKLWGAMAKITAEELAHRTSFVGWRKSLRSCLKC